MLQHFCLTTERIVINIYFQNIWCVYPFVSSTEFIVTIVVPNGSIFNNLHIEMLTGIGGGGLDCKRLEIVLCRLAESVTLRKSVHDFVSTVKVLHRSYHANQIRVTALLICAFVFAYADSWFSNAVAHLLVFQFSIGSIARVPVSPVFIEILCRLITRVLR